MPEIVSAQDLREFEARGFLIVRSLFPASALGQIASWLDELAAYPEVPGEHMMYFEETAGRRLLNRVENFAPYHAGLGALLESQELLGAVSTLFGEPAVLFKDKVNFKLPGGSGFEPHQDAQAGWSEYAPLFITAALAVDPTTPENGCLEFGHWQHRRELIGELWKPLAADQLREVELEPCPMRAGDVAYFDSFLPHASGPNRSAQARRILYITYNRAREGDHRRRYYADKRKSYPPDCEREPGKSYEYRV